MSDHGEGQGRLFLGVSMRTSRRHHGDGGGDGGGAVRPSPNLTQRPGEEYGKASASPMQTHFRWLFPDIQQESRLERGPPSNIAGQGGLGKKPERGPWNSGAQGKPRASALWSFEAEMLAPQANGLAMPFLLF